MEARISFRHTVRKAPRAAEEVDDSDFMSHVELLLGTFVRQRPAEEKKLPC
jgi:hypothetical protein